MDINKLIELFSGVGTDIIIAILKRRAAEKGMTAEELLKESTDNWSEAEKELGDLEREGHDGSPS